MWDSSAPQWVGKAALSQRHVILTTTDLMWRKFNILLYGMFGDREQSLDFIREMKQCAEAYVKAAGGWSSNVGMFFHVYGHTQVKCLQLNIIDLETVGPSFMALRHRNLSIDAVIAALEEEEGLAFIAGLADGDPAPADGAEGDRDGEVGDEEEIIERQPRVVTFGSL